MQPRPCPQALHGQALWRREQPTLAQPLVASGLAVAAFVQAGECWAWGSPWRAALLEQAPSDLDMLFFFSCSSVLIRQQFTLTLPRVTGASPFRLQTHMFHHSLCSGRVLLL